MEALEDRGKCGSSSQLSLPVGPPSSTLSAVCSKDIPEVQSRQHQTRGKFGSSLLHGGRTDGGCAVKVPVGSPAGLSYLLYHGYLLVKHQADVLCPWGGSDVKLPESDDNDPMA